MIKPEHFILEIGVGGYPFPATGNRRIEEGQVYLGIDNGSRYRNWAKVASERLEEKRVLHEGSLALISGDAIQLPFVSEFADEVVVCNVFGDYWAFPRIPYMILEIQRVLKPGGLLTVVETITPVYCPMKEVKDWVIPLNFDVQEVHEGISVELLRYYPKDCIYTESPFCISFKKL